MSTNTLTRREALASMPAIALAADTAAYDPAVVRQHDEAVARLLQMQITDPSNSNRGGYADEFGLHEPGAGSSCLLNFLAAWLCPQSSYYGKNELVDRMRLASRYLDHCQNGQGNVSLLVTNFNSPPDTGFVVHGVGAAAHLAQMNNKPEIFAMVEPWLKKAGGALAVGGVHTPNHRWVVCYALAQINELLPDERYVRRVNQWLAEGIDIDEDGQYNERSTTVYNPITDISLLVVAQKLNKPELLDPVRKNLDSMLYLIHPGGEVVTEISRRQDQYAQGDMGRYWMPLRFLASKDGNGQYAALVRQMEPKAASLPWLMEYPELRQALPASVPLPVNYEKEFKASRVVRIRRGQMDATVMLNGNSRFFTARQGDCVVQAVRFASAFFGKGQFAPGQYEKREGGWLMKESLTGPYYQPLNPPRKVGADEWGAARAQRAQSEVCKLSYEVMLRERAGGFTVDISANGTDGVPLAIEVNLRPGGQLTGCVAAPKVEDAWLLPKGHATYRVGKDMVRIGPGLGAHSYTQVRGAEAKLPGTSVYLCAYTPVRHRLEIDLG
jgi:hypothetical protein